MRCTISHGLSHGDRAECPRSGDDVNEGPQQRQHECSITSPDGVFLVGYARVSPGARGGVARFTEEARRED